MSQARINILENLKSQLKGVAPEKVPMENRYYPAALEPSDYYEHFCSHLEKNNAEVCRIPSEEVCAKVTQYMQSQGISSLMVGDKEWSNKLATTGVTILPPYQDLSVEKAQVFAAVPAALTTSIGGIALTGTIVVSPTLHEPRGLSLIPPVHIVLVEDSKIEADFPHFIAKAKWQQGMPTNVLLISGPSKTADIQQTLAYGAHGPKRLLVIVLKDR